MRQTPWRRSALAPPAITLAGTTMKIIVGFRAGGMVGADCMAKSEPEGTTLKWASTVKDSGTRLD
jgi:hypothetical protein